MVMDTLQIRLSSGLVKMIDSLVQEGIYSNRSDAIRDAVRRSFWHSQVGTIPNTGDSVKEVRKIRRQLSKQIKSYKDIEKINKEFQV
jgi:hypothetical protein